MFPKSDNADGLNYVIVRRSILEAIAQIIAIPEQLSYALVLH